MRVREVVWDRHLARAKAERVAGSTQPHKDPSPDHKIWKVSNWKNNVPGKRYTVHLWWHEGDKVNARVSCTCHAGQNNSPCKHAAWVVDQELRDVEFNEAPFKVDLTSFV